MITSYFRAYLLRGVRGEEVLLLAVHLVGNSELLAAFGAAHSQYAATVLCGHALAEAVLIVSLTVVGLESSFHDFISFILIFCEFCLF